MNNYNDKKIDSFSLYVFQFHLLVSIYTLDILKNFDTSHL